MYSTIVVGTDGSAGGTKAVDAAIRLAGLSGARLHVVVALRHLLGEDVEDTRASLPAEFRDVFDPHAARHEALAEAVVEAEQAGVAVEGHDLHENPADAILDVAEQVGADLIVVGSRGFGFTKRLFLGSVSTRLAHHAQCSVLIVYDDQHRG
jgi:nucleotide-binding universal stress UspA family protein